MNYRAIDYEMNKRLLDDMSRPLGLLRRYRKMLLALRAAQRKKVPRIDSSWARVGI